MERHLNLADLHIGELVYEYSDITEKPLCPMYVSALFEDGTVYLNFNGNEFDVWEANIEDITPVSPFDREVDFNAAHEEHMRADFKLLLDCDYILMGRDWEHSVGCRAELNVALACGMEIMFEHSETI